MIIAVSGSPGTGKTTVAKELAKKLKYKYLDVNALIKERGLSSGHDDVRNCEIIAVDVLNNELADIIKEDCGFVIDSHLSHYLPKEWVDFCIIIKCDIKVLEERLKKRKYTKDKIRENLDVEIFDTILNEAKEAEHNIVEVDTTKGYDIDKIIKKLK